MLHAHPASVQDRDGAVPLLKDARRLYPRIERAFASATAFLYAASVMLLTRRLGRCT